jgi:hypothetical protein
MRSMTFRAVLARGARRWWVAALLALCAAIGVGAYSLLGGSAGASPPSTHIATESLASFRAAVIHRLRDEHLDYLWVDCVKTPHRFEGVRVVRCNVDFGEPHIVAYCAVLRDRWLLTSEDDPAIPCGHDDAGFSAPVVQYG